jgi:hypothetical protein
MRMLMVFLLAGFSLKGQYEPTARNAFMNRDLQDAFDQWSISRPSVAFHSSFRPYLSQSYLHATDSGFPFRFYGFRNIFFSKTFNEKPEKRNWYQLQLHPITDQETGYDLLTRQAVVASTGGLHLKTSINNDFTFAATLVGGRVSFPYFLDTTIADKKVIPAFGMGYGSNTRGYQVFDYTGYISYSPNNNKVFNFQLGRDKHFIGDGYRSLLLSDFAPAYPFFRINANIWHIQYNAWYTWMYDIEKAKGVKNDFRDKYATFHYLSYNILKGLNISLFENVVWRGTDTNMVRQFDVNYLNPVIFYRPVEYANGSPDNSFIGANISAILFKRIKLYGQLALDEFYLKEIRARQGWWGNKQGWQLGFKWINAFAQKGLKLQAEYNEVRPYTYTHGLVDQNYGHYGLPLAHPLGANFREFLGIVSFRKDRMEYFWQGMYAVTGRDSASVKSNVGHNIFLSYTTRGAEYGNFTTQGIRTVIMQSHFKLTWHILPAMNMRFEAGYIQRSESNSAYALENPYLYIGFKTSFWNTYNDF